MAVALPFSGFTLFWDAGSWPSGLMAFAYTPWVWLTLRGPARHRQPVLGVLLGVLAVTHGNPYGTLALVVVGVALVVEGLLGRDVPGVLVPRRGHRVLGARPPLVYLPLLGVRSLTIRSFGALFGNSGKLRPIGATCSGLSLPLHTPPILAIIGPMTVPATFLAWFVLPLLPWLR